MITNISEGMTPDQFISAVNGNFTEVLNAFTPVAKTMSIDEFETTYNGNLTTSRILSASKGSYFKNTINTDFNNEFNSPVITPSYFTISWVIDKVKHEWVNNTSGTTIEIWESKNGADYVKGYSTIVNDLESYDYSSWQNCNCGFKIRAKKGSKYSDYTTSITLQTPLVLKTDQSTLTEISIQHLWVKNGYSINIDFGDGTSQVINQDNNYTAPNVLKNYTTEGQYIITISGDTDNIRNIFYFSGKHYYGDLTKWILPSELVIFELFNTNTINTDFSTWLPFPIPLEVININSNEWEGSFNGKSYNPIMRELLFPGNKFSGNPASNGFPEGKDSGMMLLFNENNFESDLTNIALPKNLYGANFSLNSTKTNNFYGDLSNQSMYSGTGRSFYIVAQNANFTKGYRGSFEWVSEYNFKNNLFNQAEIDSLLSYIDNYFTLGVIPLTNAIYIFNGVRMGIPSASGLISRTSIINKYTAVGKTCTITVNS